MSGCMDLAVDGIGGMTSSAGSYYVALKALIDSRAKEILEDPLAPTSNTSLKKTDILFAFLVGEGHYIKMGNMYTAYMAAPDIAPDRMNPPKHDSLYGFPDGRKERVSKISAEEMEALQIEPELRDYCAHHLKDFYQCRNDNWPMVSKCAHEKHVWDECQFNDFVLRMKEYERERRLNEREKRKLAKSLKEELE